MASLLTAAATLAGVFIGQKGVNELDKTEDHIYEIRQEIDKMEDLQRFYQLHNIIMQNPTYPKQYGILPNETQQNIPSHNMKQAASAPNGYSSNQPKTLKFKLPESEKNHFQAAFLYFLHHFPSFSSGRIVDKSR